MLRAEGGAMPEARTKFAASSAARLIPRVQAAATRSDANERVGSLFQSEINFAIASSRYNSSFGGLSGAICANYDLHADRAAGDNITIAVLSFRRHLRHAAFKMRLRPPSKIIQPGDKPLQRKCVRVRA